MSSAPPDQFGMDGNNRFRAVPDKNQPAALLRAVRADPDSERAWADLTGWLTDNGFADEAEAVQAFWPAIADSLYLGMPVGRAMDLLARNAAGLANFARRLRH